MQFESITLHPQPAKIFDLEKVLEFSPHDILKLILPYFIHYVSICTVLLRTQATVEVLSFVLRLAAYKNSHSSSNHIVLLCWYIWTGNFPILPDFTIRLLRDFLSLAKFSLHLIPFELPFRHLSLSCIRWLEQRKQPDRKRHSIFASTFLRLCYWLNLQNPLKL